MKRRSFLKSVGAVPSVESNNLVFDGLAPYTGSWDKNAVAHLLRRTTMSFDLDTLSAFVSKGLSASIDALFSPKSITDFPLNYDVGDDDEVAIGDTWINAQFDTGNGVKNYRYLSMRAWLAARSFSGEATIRHKLFLFWHNHFSISDIKDGRFLWRYTKLLHDNFDGNFKTLVEEITIDPSMLRFLNGNQNTKRAPNENYARELLELFTIGKGPQVAPGDYTNYTEEDVMAIAKVLTGWRDYNYRSASAPGFGSRFVQNNHDTTDKQLSKRFGNKVLKNNNELEYKDLVTTIFNQAEVAKFISRKLYRWFVYYEISQEVEDTIISPMAAMIISDNYRISGALKALLSSDHFYSAYVRGGMIKHPHDFMSSTVVPFRFDPNLALEQKYNYYIAWARYQSVLQMDAFELPSVAGWKAFYQTPTFYRGWINAVTLPARVKFTSALLLRGNATGGLNQRVDIIGFADSLSDPKDINLIIASLNDLLFVKPFTTAQIVTMKKIFNPGKTDADWAAEYQNMKDKPGDTTALRQVETKLGTLIAYMTYMPEYQLI